jgi:hypothetical protein
MKSISLIFASIFFAIAYGMIHDLITANICVAYFTIGHPKIIESESPIVLAFLWGTIATWWVGLIMGVILSLFNSIGKQVKLELKSIIKMILKLLLYMLVLALIAGIIGFTLTELNVIHLVPRLAKLIDSNQHSRFLAVGWAHFSSYISGIIGTWIIAFEIKKRRSRL